MHQIELSNGCVKATNKLFDYLTTDDLLEAGFNDVDVEAFGELYREIKGCIELLEMNGEIA